MRFLQHEDPNNVTIFSLESQFRAKMNNMFNNTFIRIFSKKVHENETTTRDITRRMAIADKTCVSGKN